MIRWKVILALFCTMAVSVVNAAPSTQPAEQDPLKNLRHEHPRLFRTAEGFAALKKAIANDDVLTEWKDSIAGDASDMRLTAPNTPPMVVAGQSILAEQWISTLAGMYRLNANPADLERAKAEMLALAKFPDWSPDAELMYGPTTVAMAVGYDWLYNDLSPDERKLIRTAIVEKGLKAGLPFYEKNDRWVPRNENHNQVANSCMILGALAVADEEPQIARTILNDARKSLGNSMPSFNPDGGWAEGPGYWGYGTGYQIKAFAAMQTAIGSDMGLMNEGFAVTGNFRMHAIGPFRHAWNFSDGNENTDPTPQVFWLARTFHHPEWANHEMLMCRQPTIWHLIFADDHPPAARMPDGLARDALFRETDAACFRGAWNDPLTTFVGFKSGHRRLGHWHMDVGSFVLDSQGERWALDLGTEHYSLPEYFGKLRYDYFRTRNESHNTLTINGENQDLNGLAPMVGFLSSPEKAYAVADMSGAYKLPDGSLYRGAALLNRRDVLIQDDLSGQIQRPLDVVWNMYTQAAITLNGRDATLELRGKKMFAHLLSPADAHFEIGTADAPPPQTQQPDVHSLRIRIHTTGQAERIAVFLTPKEDARSPALEALAKWVAEAPVKR